MLRFRLVLYLFLLIYAICPIKAKDTQKVLASSTVLDQRVEALQVFFRRYNSPLEYNADTFIEVADKYSLDYRLLPAISGAESTFGQNTPSCARYNPFGWTSTTSPCGYWRFQDFDEAIRYVAEKIATGSFYLAFRESGQVESLANNYNGGEPAWIEAVKFFMEQI